MKKNKYSFRKKKLNKALFLIMLAAITIQLPDNAFASGGISEFSGPLEGFLDLLKGPVARFTAMITILICGLTLAFKKADLGESMTTFLYVVICLTIALVASPVVVEWFGFSGAIMAYANY